MRNAILFTLGAILAGNGVFMLFDPAGWYALVPFVSTTGPLNPHFVRDIGCAYLVSGCALAWLAFDERARPAALAGSAFLSLHAMVHLREAAMGHNDLHHMLADLAGVVAPAVVAVCLSLRPPRVSLLKAALRRRLAAFGRANDYDTGYAHAILDADPSAFLKLAAISALAAYHKGLPGDAHRAVSLIGTMAEDCGPCTQLVVTLAEKEGMSAAVLKAVLAGEESAMPEHIRESVRFARAVLAHDPQADELRHRILARWGAQGLVSLAFALASSRLYPTLKYALGFGAACRRVRVGGDTEIVLEHAA